MGSEKLIEQVQKLKQAVEEIEQRLTAGKLPRAALGERVEQLKQTLEDFEKQLTAGELPQAVLEDFKMAVDHARTTVWTLLSTSQTDPYEITAAIIRLRLKRGVDMCRQIVLDIDSNDLTVESPELQQFHTSLKSTLARIDRLYKSGV